MARRPRRGFFGTLFKLLFIVFNLLMVLWMAGGIMALSNPDLELTEIAKHTDPETMEAARMLGGGIGLTFILFVWALGDIILGLFVLLTRPRRYSYD